ncbi:PKD domain-containing protein [Leptothrix ochracea]|uniref:PKD domain-containing protein n=1 Tax=Leptothrix ochracea TaxID=735331 RepID=UPI0034E30269
MGYRWLKSLFWSVALGLVACGGGSTPTSSEPQHPTAVIQAQAQVLATQAGTFQAALGSQVLLDGSGSSTPSGSITAYSWVLRSKPAGSNATITTPTQAWASLVPDRIGTYELTLTIADSRALASTQTLTFVVSQSTPVVAISQSIVFNGSATNRPLQNVAVGSLITLDGSASTSPDGSAVTLSWVMLQKPSTSQAVIQVSGSTAFFTADVAGNYQLRVRGTNQVGASTDVVYSYNALSNGPSIVMSAQIATASGSTTLSTAVGNFVLLDSSASLVVGGNTTLRGWALLSKPAGSTATLSASTGVNTNFIPDVVGNYVIQLVVQDLHTGLSQAHTVSVTAQQGPVAVVSGQPTPVALITAPGLVSAAGVPVTLRGSGSYSPDGSALSYQWSLLNKPATSAAILTALTQADLSFTPDINGSYTLQLAVSNTAGDTALRQITLFVGNYPPVLVLDRTQVHLPLGRSVTVSAANSQSQGGGALSYSWSIDAQPPGSTAVIAAPTLSALTFTPDVAGSYYLTVRVTEGAVSSIAGVSVTVMAPVPGTLLLNEVPLQIQYSKSQGKVVMAAAGPDALHVVDPNAGTDIAVLLPTAVKGLTLSPDGLLAAVLHEGAVSLVDVASATLLQTSPTGGAQTEALVNNAGRIYLTGQTGAQWVTPDISLMDGRSGAILQASTGTFGNVYGTTRGAYADLIHKIFILSQGLSPLQIYAYPVDPFTGVITGPEVGSPYWGDYAMDVPFWLSSDERLLFTAAGTFFSTVDLSYVRSFGVTVQSMSHSATAQEAVVLAQGLAPNYPGFYKRFTGPLLFPAPDVTLPSIAGLPTYGIAIFHDSADRHVLVVQANSDLPGAAGADYYVMVR